VGETKERCYTLSNGLKGESRVSIDSESRKPQSMCRRSGKNVIVCMQVVRKGEYQER
jgi:hypothetical protein